MLEAASGRANEECMFHIILDHFRSKGFAVNFARGVVSGVGRRRRDLLALARMANSETFKVSARCY